MTEASSWEQILDFSNRANPYPLYDELRRTPVTQLADGSYQISATGPVYRGPGAAASGPLHHYVFELYALDTKLDVKPSADAFETRANVIKAIQGHILAKAVYGGLFRRPQ